MPVNGRRFRQMVDESHTQPVALSPTQLQAWRLPAVSPGGRRMARHQLDIERRGNQFVIMRGDIGGTSQPVTSAASTKADHSETGKAGKNFSAGERHVIPVCNIDKMRDFLTC